jgi:hypothetical protein
MSAIAIVTSTVALAAPFGGGRLDPSAWRRLDCAALDRPIAEPPQNRKDPISHDRGRAGPRGALIHLCRTCPFGASMTFAEPPQVA